MKDELGYRIKLGLVIVYSVGILTLCGVCLWVAVRAVN